MSRFIPNSFQVPNALVDELLAKMSGNASKCYLIIARKTRGWQKEMDRISRSQFMRFSGLSKPTVIKACNELIELNILKSEEVGQDIFYELDESNFFTSKESLPVKNFDQTSKESLPVTSKEFLPTKTNIKTTNKNKENMSFDDKNSNPPCKNEIDFNLVLDAYNDAAADRLPKIKKLDENRKRAIKKLLKEFEQPTFQSLADYFYKFVDNAKSFYFGDNERGWKADFDYIIKPSTYLKVFEERL